MIELTQIMRQKDDQPFIELLNRFRTASQNDEDIQCINLRTTSSSDDNIIIHLMLCTYGLKTFW